MQSSLLRELIALLTIITTIETAPLSDCSNPYTTSCDARCDGSCAEYNDYFYCCGNCVTSYNSVDYYKWPSTDAFFRCDSYCPDHYYQDQSAGTYYVCSICDALCYRCTTSGNNNCIDCAATSYQKDSTTCDNQLSTTSYNPCTGAYYGIYTTMQCQPCPTGCLTCHLSQTKQITGFDSSTYSWTPACVGDGLCSYALQCYSCDTAYILVEGQCPTRSRCLRYSFYNSTASGFSASYCYCKTSFYLSGLTFCSLCHWSCSTCSGDADTDCLTCHSGGILSSGKCVANATFAYIQTWNNSVDLTNWVTTQSASTRSTASSASTNCTSGSWVFGYYGYDTSLVSLFNYATLTFTSSHASLSFAHYAVYFKARFLFIDDWVDGSYVYFYENNQAVYTYRYGMQKILGQFMCGLATHDHQDYISFRFSHTRTSITNLKISTSVNGPQWGINNVVVGVMLCDSSCLSCSGPTQYNCLTCGTNQVLVNGDCVCDSANGYFNDTTAGTGCVTDCSSNYYGNPYTRTCTADCTTGVTYLFMNYDSSASVNQRVCMQNCPSTRWKYYLTMQCVDECYDTALNNDAANYYKFSGTDKVCYNICPTGYYGDPNSKYCVSLCPLVGTVLYYQQSNICVEHCTAPLAAYPLTRKCLSTCPTGFYKNIDPLASSSYVCQKICTVTLSGVNKYGDNTTNTCVNVCPSGSYADSDLHLCVSNCNSSAFKQVVGTARQCVLLCSVADSLYGNVLTGKCVVSTSCPLNTYGDTHTTYCQQYCSLSTEFGDNTTRLCQAACTNTSNFKQNSTTRCVATCPVNVTVPQFGDHIFGNDFCVSACQTVSSVSTFADAQANRECVYVCSSTPVATFGQNNVCVYKCSGSNYGDVTQNRTCVLACGVLSGVQTYGQNQTRMCVSKCPDTLFGVTISSIPVCVYKCPDLSVSTLGMFGNVITNLCVDKCPAPYYGDPTANRSCVLQCANGYFAQNTTAGVISDVRVCVADCATGWADNITRKCAITSAGCSAGLYAHETDRKCVLPAGCTGYADPTTRYCVPVCPNITDFYFGDPLTKMCVKRCPENPNYFGDKHTSLCSASCTYSGQVRDPQSTYRWCVTACTRTPVALFVDETADLCVAAGTCTTGYYSDNYTQKCETDCQGTTDQYADPVSGNCVAQCQLNWYGYNSSTNVGVCVTRCPLYLWADNLTVLCTNQCSANTYGVNYTDTVPPYGICQSECPDGQWARDTDNICVSNCGASLWGNNQTNKCVTDPFDCQTGTYADDTYSMCVQSVDCSVNAGVYWVADNVTNKCLAECPDNDAANNFYNWADMIKRLCVAKCPDSYFGYNNTKKCQTECRDVIGGSWPSTTQFADSQLRLCVPLCSIYPISTFGQNVTYTCVEAKNCPTETWAQITTDGNRLCVDKCLMIPQEYADNITKSCVTTCPTYFYGDIQRGYGMCVSVCPSTNTSTPVLQFSDNYTKTCVTICPSSQGTFGDVVSLSCVLTCPLTYFAQQSPSRHCVQVCSLGTWGNSVRRFCQTSSSNCQTVNGLHYYGDDSNTLCVAVCPAAAGTWGQNTTYYCQSTCTTGFKYNATRVCIDLCPAEIDGNGSFSDVGAAGAMCFYVCVTTGYYRDAQNARSCQPSCSYSPVLYYMDSTTMRCVLKCPTYPQYYYAYDSGSGGECLATCPGTLKQYTANMTCIASCPTGTFLTTLTNQCVSECPTDSTSNVQYFGDSLQVLCVIATDCSTDYYADSNVGLCVLACSQDQWKYGKSCVTFCPDGYYGHPTTLFCVVPLDCPTDYYAENVTRTCTSQCNGTFADISLKVCLDVCLGSLYADPITHICAATCTNNATISLHSDPTTKTCISSCDQDQYLVPTNNSCESACPDPYYADGNTQVCVSVCPSLTNLYGENVTNQCVEDCGTMFKYIVGRVCVTDCPSGYYRDNFTRECALLCGNNTFADDVTNYCVSDCTPRYALDDPINICTDTCPSPYYKDPTTYICVTECPSDPAQYFKATFSGINTCSLTCPTGEYRDYLTYSCVAICPPSPATFADPTTLNCVSVCPASPTDLYANKDTRTCVATCPGGMFTQNNTRTCVYTCPSGLDLYSDTTTTPPSCVHLCSSGLYADPYTLTCTAACTTSPQTYGFDNTTHRICLQSCPYPYLADLTTKTCKLDCSGINYKYIDQASQNCVSVCTSQLYSFAYMPDGQTVNGQCVKFCPSGFYALLTNNSCVKRCPSGYYGDDTNNTCYTNCTLTNNKFADDLSNLCISVCPTGYYGDRYSRTCMSDCPTDKLTIKDTHTRQCQPKCSVTSQYVDPLLNTCVTLCSSNSYADPTTQVCESSCALYSMLYAYDGNWSCVEQCPVYGLYANDESRKCVAALDCQDGYFGLDPQRICIEVCPIDMDYYGDPISQTCVATCPTSYYADPSTRMCVLQCPAVPSLFGKLSSQRCLAECPNGQFADNQTRTCVDVCSSSPIQTFADNSTYHCVQKCPNIPNYFSQNQTYTCVAVCPSTPSMFADYSTRTCVFECPGGDVPTFADNSTRICVEVCPGSTYMQNSTRTCVSVCTQGFADPTSKFCVAECYAQWYGILSSRVCTTDCPVSSPQLYAEDSNHMCQSACLEADGTFRDRTTFKCVKICPISAGLFAQPQNRLCVDTCLSSPKQFADFSSRSCIQVCPMIPSLFGDNDTITCVDVCPTNTFADNQTRLCVLICPSTPLDTYGDKSTWTCVAKCPSMPTFTWSDDTTRTCVSDCPSSADYYADNSTGKCQASCTAGTFADSTTYRCVETCPQGWFGRNATWRCVLTCQTGQFADDLLNLCVAKCPIDPIFYGNPDIHICVSQCPASNYSFGNPLTQQCVKYSSTLSGCPSYYYSDNSTRLCVLKCPLLQDTYGDNSTWKCVAVCPSTQSTYSDNYTMMCVSICPQYPEYYAQEYSRRCVSLCLQANSSYSGSFADNSTRKCVQTCPSSPDYFSDNSTRKCVFYCSYEPLTFADYSTRRCVTTCPTSPDLFGDQKSRRCVLVCPQSQLTYADYNTRLCLRVCPSPLFGNNDTNRCVVFSGCPTGSYADNATRLCVAVCPQYPDTYGDYSTKQCVTTCPSTPDLYADPLTQTCVSRCPTGTYAHNLTRRCVAYCPMTQINYADNLTNRCVSICPASQSTYGDNSTQQCVSQCPDVPFTYADNITQNCLAICQNVTNGGYAENTSRICVIKCPDQSYGDITTRYCVRYCPNGWYAYSLTNLCVQTCPSPYFGDNTTWTCVLVCPVAQLLFGQRINRTCTPICPLGTYADSYSQECVIQCPGLLHDTFAYEDNRTCVQQCPVPLYGYPVTWVCIAVCLDPYYQNITNHRCQKCPSACTVCTYPQNCVTCASGYYLYGGACLQSCPTFPTITYANPSGVCGSAVQCTSGYFALNTTKTCVRVCPAGFYKNTTTQTCDSCLAGCQQCTNSKTCITCNSSIAIWDSSTCYSFCSPLRRYYTSTGCVSSCPTGYYLQLVNCLACSSICQSCIVQPQNCLTCANGYYLSNNLCVSKCPANTKAVSESGKLYCKSCSLTDCTITPLTYNITQYVDNYQYKFKWVFSEKVNITKQIDKIIRIKQITSSRRVLALVYSYLDYTIYDYGNGEYVFVLNSFDARENSDLQFSFQIIDPQAIVSPSGQFPSTTRTVVAISQASYYSISDYNENIANYCLVASLVTIFLLAFTFTASHQIWMPVIDFFHLIFALLFINVILPPNPAYAFSKAKVAALTWIPNMFESALPKVRFSKTVSSMIFTFFGDLIFLRSMGFLYTVLLGTLVVVLAMVFFWKKGSNKFLKKHSKHHLKQTIWKRDLHGIVYLFYLPTLLVGLMKMRNYTSSTAIQGFSIFSSFLFMLPMLLLPIYYIYKVLRLIRDHPTTYAMLKKAYDYISSREIVLHENPIYHFKNQNNQIDLKQLHKPKVNQISILPYPVYTRLGGVQVTMPIIQYIFKFFIAFFIVVSYQNASAQLFLILLITIINIVYFAYVKPYIHSTKKIYTNYIVLANLTVFCLILITIIVLQLQSSVLSYDSRIIVGNVMAALVILGFSYNVLYMVWRTYHWYQEHIWRPFVFSQIFQNNYTLQYWDYKKEYEVEDKDKKGKTGNREEFLNAIKLQNKFDALQSIVKKDPNSSEVLSKSGKKVQVKGFNLRPNRNQILKKQITSMFQTFNNDKQRSQNSLKSSERLSKHERNKVRDVIFGDKDLKHNVKDDYESMKIQQISEQNAQQNLVEQETEYEYQYIDQQYPEGTDMQEILKNCKKGEVIIP